MHTPVYLIKIAIADVFFFHLLRKVICFPNLNQLKLIIYENIQTFEIYPTGRFLFNNEVQCIKDEKANIKAITEYIVEPDILKITFNARIVNRAAMQEKVNNILISTISKKNNKTD